MSIAQSVLDIALQEGRQHGLKQISIIRLQVGALAAVVPESLKFCFAMLSRDTIASGSDLEIETVPIVARCSACKELFEVENHIYLCPQCEEPALELVSGRELCLLSIEGETGDYHDADENPGRSEHSAG